MIHFPSVMEALGQALDVHASSDTSIQTVIETFLQTKNLLIVMDNFEQVLQAAPALIEILNRAPQVKFLVTSREALHVPGENEYHLEPLPLPSDAHAQTYLLMTSPAIQLFVQRASAADASFALTEENASHIADVCHHLDGLPLAIELAAARIQTLSPAAMLQQIERRFNWLSRGRSDAPTSRQTLSGAITWSYQLLSEPERILFQRLAIFEGSWDLEAVEKICSDDVNCPPAEIFNILLHLSDRSLVAVDAKETGTRYRYLETIRHFAREKLEQSNEMIELRNRHLSHFTDWAGEMESLMNKLPPLEFRRSVEQEHNNIYAALAWALNNGASDETGYRLTASISTVWLKLSYYKQALEWVEQFLPLTQTDHKAHRARLLYLKAALSYWRDNLEVALASGLEAETLSREINDQKLLANALYYLGGSIYRELGNYEKAIPCLEESIALCRENHLFSRLSIALAGHGAILFQQGKKVEAQRMVDEALKIAMHEKDLWGQGYVFRVHADFLRADRKFSESLELYKRAFAIAQSIDDRISMGMELANMSLLANVLGEYPASGQYAEAALSVFQIIGNEYQQPFPQRMIAYAALHEHNIPRAKSFCADSLRGNQKLGHTTGTLACLLAFAEIELASGNEALAVRLYGFVKTQVEKESLQLMESDDAALKRLEINISSTVDKTLSEITIDALVGELKVRL